MCGRARLARARRGRGRRLGAAGQPEPVHLADHGVAGDAAELCGDLTRRQAVGPQLLQQSRRVRQSSSCLVPRQWPSRRRPGRIQRLVWATTGWPDAYSRYRFTLETCPPHEMSYLTIEKLQYGGSSGARVASLASTCSAARALVHLSALMASRICCAARLTGTPAPVMLMPLVSRNVDSRRVLQ